MKLSIIVPIYNVAPYLRKCVDSLLAQDISDYEIILVDDGSTDNSGAIADEISDAFRLSPLAYNYASSISRTLVSAKHAIQVHALLKVSILCLWIAMTICNLMY